MKVFLPNLLIVTLLISVKGLAESSTNNLYNLSLQELSQVDVTIATGNATPLDKAPASASVLSSADITASGARTLDDLLQMIPGVHVAPSAFSRLDSIYYIRGIHTGFNSQVLLMLNGVPVQNTVQGGRPTLFRFPVTSIERVEVIRGPGSAIYGADAYAGVINVITRDFATLPSEELNLGAGSFNSREYNFSGATDWRDIQMSLIMTYQKTDGDKSRRVSRDLQSLLDQNLMTNASLAPGPLSTAYEVMDTHINLKTEQWNLNFWNWLLRDAGIGAGGAQALDPNGEENGDIYMVDYAYDFTMPSENLKTRLKVNWFRYDQRTQFNLLPPGALVPIGEDGNINFASPKGVVLFEDGVIGNPGGVFGEQHIELVSIYDASESHQLRLALGARRMTIDTYESKNYGPGVLDVDPLPAVVSGSLTRVTDTPAVFFSNHSRNVQYISLQDEWALLDNLQITSGIRYDDYSDFGSTVNPRVALVYSMTDSLIAKVLYGSAFRAPSFSELYLRNNPIALGNEKLKPEDIDTTELSFNWQASARVQTILTLFQYDAKDLISFEPSGQNADLVATNAMNQTATGAEFEVNWHLADHWRLNSSYSVQDAINARDDTPVADRPRRLGKMNLAYHHNDWVVNTQVFYVGDRRRETGDLRKPIDDYWLLNTNIMRKNLFPKTDVHLTLRNLLDEDIREPSTGEIPEDYPMESRSVWLGLTLSL
jgi:outer membrane receptor for ferrienterochelin and colicins